MTPSLCIAVVGAGLSGLSCAHSLRAAGAQVQLFEKSRGPSGRMSTRRGEGWQCDHGAQYFTARDPAFRAEVMRWQEAGAAAPWEAQWAVVDADGAHRHEPSVARFVGTPRMTSPAAWLSSQLNLRTGHTVDALAHDAQGWRLHTLEHGELATQFDVVVLAIPSPQAAQLLHTVAPDLSALADDTVMRGSWAVMLRFDAPVALPFDAAFVNTGPLRWVARDSSKPGRSGPETWLLHGSPEWSQAHIEAEPESAAAVLIDAFVAMGGSSAAAWAAHRWRYADTASQRSERCVWRAHIGLGLCGDWLHGGKVEGAWLSGQALAKAVMATHPLLKRASI